MAGCRLVLVLRIKAPLVTEETIFHMTNDPVGKAASAAAVEGRMRLQGVSAVSGSTQKNSPNGGAMPPLTRRPAEGSGQQENERENDAAAHPCSVQFFQLERASEEDRRTFENDFPAFCSHLRRLSYRPSTVRKYAKAIKMLFVKHQRSLHAMASETYCEHVKSTEVGNKGAKMAALRHLGVFIGTGAKNDDPLTRTLSKPASCGPRPCSRRHASKRALQQEPSAIEAREAAKTLFVVQSNAAGGSGLFLERVALLKTKVQVLPNQRLRARIQRIIACMVERSRHSMHTAATWRRFLPTVLFLLGMRRSEIDGLVEKHRLCRKRIANAKRSLYAMEDKRRRTKHGASKNGASSTTCQNSAEVKSL